MTEEEIARHLAQAQAAGELQSAPSYGRPLAEDDAWRQTPEGLRMPFKILKDAGVPPPEIELFHHRAALRAALDAETAQDERARLQRALAELEQALSLRLEALRRHASL
jgi:hypothetical protein